jgi:hypothetical protein
MWAYSLHSAGSLEPLKECWWKSLVKLSLNMRAWIKLEYPFGNKFMKIMAAVFLAMFTVGSAEAGPQPNRGSVHHYSNFRSQSAAAHFIAGSGNGFHRRFHYETGGVVIFNDNGGDGGVADDDTVYQGQVAPQDAESLPYATPTSDPDTVISPFEPHASINVAGVPHGAKVQDPISSLIFLNP